MRKETSATLRDLEKIEQNSLKEDKVIGLRCKSWPQKHWKTFVDRKPRNLADIMDKIKGQLFGILKPCIILNKLSLLMLTNV